MQYEITPRPKRAIRALVRYGYEDITYALNWKVIDVVDTEEPRDGL